jgi:predicted Zn-dependent protease
MASYSFDDNGVRATKEYLIKEGTLVAGIGGIESQKRSGLNGVSCARATSWNRPPMDRMGNINIEPGESTVEEMIKSTENGVLMQTNRSWSIDDYRNKFQFGCEYGRVIKDGELGGVVKNPNYRSSTVQFWNSLSHVGNKDSFEIWGSPYCGKGEPNQVIRVGHAIPTCKFKNIEVFGGA